MNALLTPPVAPLRTLADLLARLGNVPAERVRFHPPPGLATEKDLLACLDHEHLLCELIEGVLVEKAMGFRESLLAAALITLFNNHPPLRRSGIITGADGTLRLFPGLIRIPDVAFTSWDRLPGRRIPAEPIPAVVPDLAVEVLSVSNTRGEMELKRQEYFAAGVRLLWYVDPSSRTVAVHTGLDQTIVLDATQTLEGGDVLPGFTLSLAEFFAELDRHDTGDVTCP